MNAGEQGVRYVVYGFLGVVYFISGALILAYMGSDGNCMFRFTTSTAYRTGAGSDDLGYGAPVVNAVPNDYTASILIGLALLLDGLYRFVLSFMWEDTKLQIEEDFNRNRWVMGTISDVLIFVTFSYIVGFTDNITITLIAFLVLALNFVHSTNEALNCAGVQVDKERSGQPAVNAMPRVEAWLIAFTLFTVIVAVWSVTYSFSAQTPGSNTNWMLGLFVAFVVVYYFRQFAILFYLTNKVASKAEHWEREWWFAGFRFLLFLTAALINVDLRGAVCPQI